MDGYFCSEHFHNDTDHWSGIDGIQSCTLQNTKDVNKPIGKLNNEKV